MKLYNIKGEQTIFGVCWLTYVITYLCRVNFSSALPKLANNMQIDISMLGIVGSLFFFTYAIGQLINGYLGDKFSPYKFIAVAIIGTGLLNFILSFAKNYVVILILWGLNGYFQSMIWGPLMRILSERFSKEETVKVSTGISTSMVVGFVLSWTVFGRLFLYKPWQFYFRIPALLAVIAGVFWLLLADRHKKNHLHKEKKVAQKGALLHTIIDEKVWLIVLVCLCLGIIKESLSMWAPVMMTDMLGIEIKQSFKFILFIPLANFLGILFSRKLVVKFCGNIKATLTVMFSTAAFCSICLMLTYSKSIYLSIFLIAVISGMMYGCNTILLSVIPISFANKNIVSTLVGVFDFSSYVGAAISSLILGMVLTNKNYYSIFIIWLLVCTLALLLMRLCKLQISSENTTKK